MGNKRKLSRNQRKVLKKKLKKQKQSLDVQVSKDAVINGNSDLFKKQFQISACEQDIEYIEEKPVFTDIAEFENVNALYTPIDPNPPSSELDIDDNQSFYETTEKEEKKEGLSKKELKKLKLESVSKLKTLVSRPDLVDSHDISSSDPPFLIFLKSQQNSVPIPSHWNSKHRYLQQNRSRTKTRYKLPDFISETNVNKIQQTVNHMNDQRMRTSKQMARERTRPRLGLIDLNFQKLHDAFFKFQKRFYVPKITETFTEHGRMFQEAHEFSDFSTKFGRRRVKLGKLSEKTRTALGMGQLSPVPWLVNMQRYGPPLSYPDWQVPGVNGPIPDGARWGFGKDEWGRPPVDANNVPLYGNAVLATPATETKDTKLWGELESDYEEESEEEDEDEFMNEDLKEAKEINILQEQFDEIADQPLEEVEEKEEPVAAVRKEGKERDLYEVIEQKTVKQGDGIIGTDFVYELTEEKPIEVSKEKDEDEDDPEKDEYEFKF